MKKNDMPEYHVYYNLRRKCRHENHIAYKWYGGRGIKFLYKSFEEFIADVGKRPNDKYTIDRIDNNGHYQIGNLRWATMSQQAHNRRKKITNTSGYTGVHKYKANNKWQARLQIHGKRVSLGYYDTPEEAAVAYKQSKIQYGLLK